MPVSVPVWGGPVEYVLRVMVMVIVVLYEAEEVPLQFVYLVGHIDGRHQEENRNDVGQAHVEITGILQQSPQNQSQRVTEAAGNNDHGVTGARISDIS